MMDEIVRSACTAEVTKSSNASDLIRVFIKIFSLLLSEAKTHCRPNVPNHNGLLKTNHPEKSIIRKYIHIYAYGYVYMYWEKKRELAKKKNME